MRRLARIIALLAIAAIAVVAVQWISRRPAAQEAAQQPRERPAPLVRTAVVERAALTEQVELPGEVRASATADVTSRLAGRLGAVLIKEGSYVGAGSLVARIDDPELLLAVRQADAAVEVQRARLAQLRAGPRAPEVAQVEAEIAQAQTALAQAERELARTQQLFSDGLIARAAVDRAQTDVELARGRLQATRERLAIVRMGPRDEDIRAQVAQLRQTEVQAAQARARLRDLRIISPIAGVVTRVNVERGSVVSSQTVVATVATIRPIEIHVPLPETDMPRLREASTVRVQVDALPARLFTGKIARIAPALDPATRSARLVVEVPNADRTLRPGMFARATVVFDERQAVVIPSDVIVRRGETAVVFVVKGDAVEERPVKAGYVEGSRTEIVQGLDAGAVIVTAGQQGLRDGMKVRTGPARGGPGASGEGPGRSGRPSRQAPRPSP